MLNEVLTCAQERRTQIVDDLKQLLSIPSVSTLPEHASDMENTARWLAEKLTTMGMENVELLSTPGYPVVYADWLKAGPEVPTLLIYGHYDVQPVDPLNEWESPPFEPTIRGKDIFARGTTDNKGQFYVHLAALESYLQSEGTLPLNVKVMLEGEEEIGSPHLKQFLLDHQDKLQADAAVISDTPIVDPQTPAIVTGLRGLVYLELEMIGSRHDLHSGVFGGVIENPMNAMAKLLASLWDEKGRVTIPGFYDDVRELTAAEREEINKAPFTSEAVLADTQAPALWGEEGYTVPERLGARPTLDVHGIRGGFVGEGSKTVIPSKALAKVSMRLVPHQQPEKIAQLFEDHIQNIGPKTMKISIKRHGLAESALIDSSAPAIQAAATAYEKGFGKQPIYLREGGTLPVVSMFGDLLNLPVVMMGFGLPDDRLHAPNEKFHLPNFYRGIDTAIHYYYILGQMRDE